MKTLLWFVLFCILLQLDVSAYVGDEWEGRRGDSNPGVRYSAMTIASGGRILAVGSGHLMVSDDNGANWRYETMSTSTGIVKGRVSELIRMNSGRLVALVVWMEPGGPLGYKARTYVYTSDNNGDVWEERPFPHTTATFRGHTYHGVNLHGLHLSPAGELLAFGTTTVSAELFVYWSIGGLIYRSSNAESWTQSHFAHGPISEMADANGRLVAAGYVTALDSADGAGWNGYLMESAQVQTPGGQPLDSDVVRRIRLLDVAVQDGTYVAHAVTMVPLTNIIDSSTVARRFMLKSDAPFAGNRLWTAYEYSPAFNPGKFWASGSGLLGFGWGVQVTGNGGQSWSMRDATVHLPTRTFAESGSAITAIGSSREAWRSTNSGSSWSKILDLPALPNLRPLGTFNGTVFASDSYNLYASEDNGVEWVLRASAVSGAYMCEANGRLFLTTNGASLIRISDDNGYTWTTRNLGGDAGASIGPVAISSSGVILQTAAGRDVSNNGKFFISTTNGESWAQVNAKTQWLETPKAALATQSGRLLVFTNWGSIWDPRLLKSDDNGQTWIEDLQFRSMEGLDPVSNIPEQKVLEVRTILQNPETGRILMVGDDDILTSDDDGETWTVRVNMDHPFTPPNLFWRIHDVRWSNGRWVGIYSKRNAANQTVYYSYVSGDDGVTWREQPLPLKQVNTAIQYVTVGLDGRIIAAGTNGAIYTTDPPTLPEPNDQTAIVREGTTLNLSVPRPPLPGAFTARYRTIDGTATAGSHYVAAVGEVQWADGDEAPKTVSIATIDNSVSNPARDLLLAIAVEVDEVGGEVEMPISILDDDGGATAGIQLAGGSDLYTTEAGGSTTLMVALNRKPMAAVTLSITGLNTAEGHLSLTSLTFTPENWNLQQEVVITGVDDWMHDGDATYGLTLTAASADAAYTGPNTVAFVTNLDDDPPSAGRFFMVSQQLLLDLSRFAHVVAVKKLPLGMKWDPIARVLVGKPKKAGTFAVQIITLAEDGTRVTQIVPLTIHPLPATMQGAFSAWIDRNSALNDDLGGSLQIRVTKSGSFSGSLLAGKAKYALRGFMDAHSVLPPKVTASVNRRGLPPLTLDLILQNNLVTGTVTDGADTTDAKGWRQVWHKKQKPPLSQIVGRINTLHTVKVAPWLADPSVPQGISYTSLLINTSGQVRWAGQLSDGTKLTGSSGLGPSRQVAMWKNLYKNTGSFIATGVLDANASLTGSATWMKQPQTSLRERKYRNGFGHDSNGPVQLEVEGKKWTPPARGDIVLGLPQIEPNARLQVSSGGVGASATAVSPTNLTIDTRNRVVAASNEAGLSARIASTSGLMSIRFQINDDNPENPGRNLRRTVNATALLVPDLTDDLLGGGSFMLPQLADPPNTTGGTSPILSGQIYLRQVEP